MWLISLFILYNLFVRFCLHYAGLVLWNTGCLKKRNRHVKKAICTRPYTFHLAILTELWYFAYLIQGSGFWGEKLNKPLLSFWSVSFILYVNAILVLCSFLNKICLNQKRNAHILGLFLWCNVTAHLHKLKHCKFLSMIFI